MNRTGTGATFREWSNLISLTTTLVIYPVMLLRWADHPHSRLDLAWLLFIGVVLQVVLAILMHALLAIFTKSEPDDERVRAIEHRAARVRGTLLALGVFVTIAMTILQELRPAWSDSQNELLESPIIVGYALFGVFYFAEVVRMTLVAVGYRGS